MANIAQYSNENMPMQDILSEIRKMVSNEANARYAREKTVAKRELLILRPEARVDLLLQEADRDIELKTEPVEKTTRARKPDDFTAKLQMAIGVSDPEELEALIRKVFQAEMTTFGD